MYEDSFASISLRALPQCNTLTIRIYFGINTINYLLLKSHRTGCMYYVFHKFNSFNYTSSIMTLHQKQGKCYMDEGRCLRYVMKYVWEGKDRIIFEMSEIRCLIANICPFHYYANFYIKGRMNSICRNTLSRACPLNFLLSKCCLTAVYLYVRCFMSDV